MRFAPEDRIFLAALLTSLPRQVLRQVRLVVRPDTILRRHRDLVKQRHARTCRPKRPGRPPTVRSIRALVLRLVKENPSWGSWLEHDEVSGILLTVLWSSLYLILGRVFQLLVLLGRGDRPKRSRSWCFVIRSPCCAVR
ncbi:hypothetical protein [Acrocarpospora macrocephala]|uniref:hypothetical protein n=1 Tax=Acrocarpospora macrocephala TaxID=150177 RepID=UPI001C3FEF35|nr:hypothetical protein [Acrocarpospora macrocephala]